MGQNSLGNLTYTYDLAGRRTSMGGSLAQGNLPNAISTTAYDASNELTQWGTATPTYDANGNMLSDGTNTYVWDARNHLASMDSGADTFQYGPFERRVAKTTILGTTNYSYDGENPVQELSGTTPTANMLTGLGVDEYLQRTDASGNADFLTDALGSTIELTDNSGSSLAQYTYEPFGNTTATGTSSNPYQYTARENDGTGIEFYRSRYYSPTFQRFISEDHIGLLGGDANLYVYAQNSPSNERDANGTNPACAIGALVAYDGYLGVQVYDELAGRKSKFGAGWRGAWNGLVGGVPWAMAGCAAGFGGEWALQQGLSAGADQAVFFYGQDASDAAAASSGTPIFQTPVGSVLNALGDYVPNSVWNYASSLYADSATGDVTVYAGSYAGAPPGAVANSIFWNTELPILNENLGITNIDWTNVP
ncbi:MAG TPA: RHS repeat-associated core domain-containing protein [Candidatus Dormibacteraeota bacterium]|nr:RHS repeat-associated core domain-containing protein [Candidatus Dormibacteraeota bacterium]